MFWFHRLLGCWHIIPYPVRIYVRFYKQDNIFILILYFKTNKILKNFFNVKLFTKYWTYWIIYGIYFKFWLCEKIFMKNSQKFEHVSEKLDGDRWDSGVLNSHALDYSWLNARIFWMLWTIELIIFRKLHYMLMDISSAGSLRALKIPSINETIEHFLARFQNCLTKILINFMCHKNNKF